MIQFQTRTQLQRAISNLRCQIEQMTNDIAICSSIPPIPDDLIRVCRISKTGNVCVNVQEAARLGFSVPDEHNPHLLQVLRTHFSFAQRVESSVLNDVAAKCRGTSLSDCIRKCRDELSELQIKLDSTQHFEHKGDIPTDLKSEAQWRRVGYVITGEPVASFSDRETLLYPMISVCRLSDLDSKTGWRRRGRRVVNQDQIALWKPWRYGAVPQYHISNTVPLAVRTDNPAVALPLVEENVLAAIFSVNRAAKRYRDAAIRLYKTARQRRSNHGLVKAAKNKKKQLYVLKEQGVIFAFRQSWIDFDGLHGNLAVYRGSGYCFHSPLRPRIAEPAEHSTSDESLFVESKPKGSGELRLKDAVATLEQLNENTNAFVMGPMPEFPRNHRPSEWYDGQFPTEDFACISPDNDCLLDH